MIDTHFTFRDLIFLASGILLALISIILFVQGNRKVSLVLLIAAAFALRLWMSVIDPYLNFWDEQFHAVVARNFLNHWWTPKLYETNFLPFDPNLWSENEIWLHKPPLFLWQMAISIKLFGLSPFAIRLPSVILSTCTIPCIYRIGTLIRNTKTGYISALLLTFSNIHLETITGLTNTDQNDVVFMCYTFFSLWAFTEYWFSRRKTFIVLTGLLAGCAVLVKMYIGLFVFGIWGLALIIEKENVLKRRSWIDFITALSISCLVFLPWIAYINYRWPLLAHHESQQQLLHITKAIEGHKEAWWYYFALIPEQYDWMGWFIILSVILFAVNRQVKLDIRISFLSCILFIYALYTVAQTKMPLFTLPVSGLLILMLGTMLGELFNSVFFTKLKFYRIVVATGLIFLTYQILILGRIEQNHTNRSGKNKYRTSRMHNDIIFREVASELKGTNTVIFNTQHANNMILMFYSGLAAYNQIPDAKTIQDISSRNFQVAVFDNGQLPEYISSDPAIIKLRQKIDTTSW